MSRLGDWWRRENARPQPSPFDAGRASIPYLELGRADLAAFHRSETYLLREIVEARSWGRHLDGLDDAPAANGWVVMPGRVWSALMDDTKGTGPGRAVMDTVVEWLVDAGALRPIVDEARAAIAEATVARRVQDHPGYVGVGRRDWDDDMWEVDPQRMLAVYPHLADTNDDWQRAAERRSP